MNDSIACWLSIVGTLLLALHLDCSKYAFILLLISSMLWVDYGKRIDNFNIVIMNIFFTLINFIGIVRWLI